MVASEAMKEKEEKEDEKEEGEWVFVKKGQRVIEGALLDEVYEIICRLEERFAKREQDRLEADYTK